MLLVNWPTLAALKATLDVSGDEWDEQLENALEAGINRVKADVALWTERGYDYGPDFPDEALANAALRAAVLLRPNADPGVDVGADPIYRAYMTGKRRRFPIS
jgi:hypothetical protein